MPTQPVTSRRAFLATLLPAAAGALALDPEWLTWRPGAKAIVDLGAIRGYRGGALAFVGGSGLAVSLPVDGRTLPGLAVSLPVDRTSRTYTFTTPDGRAWRLVSAWSQVDDGLLVVEHVPPA